MENSINKISKSSTSLSDGNNIEDQDWLDYLAWEEQDYANRLDESKRHRYRPGDKSKPILFNPDISIDDRRTPKILPDLAESDAESAGQPPAVKPKTPDIQPGFQAGNGYAFNYGEPTQVDVNQDPRPYVSPETEKLLDSLFDAAVKTGYLEQSGYYPQQKEIDDYLARRHWLKPEYILEQIAADSVGQMANLGYLNQNGYYPNQEDVDSLLKSMFRWRR